LIVSTTAATSSSSPIASSSSSPLTVQAMPASMVGLLQISIDVAAAVTASSYSSCSPRRHRFFFRSLSMLPQ
ncbi:hypothetical protein PIB30_044038, partial [Stylosanthes scabra]|nr:hypothetical protein [Stylosanthes scabra]